MPQGTNGRPGNPRDVTDDQTSNALQAPGRMRGRARTTLLRFAEELRSTDPEREVTDGDLAAIAAQVSVGDLGSVAEQVDAEGLAALAGQVPDTDLESISTQVSDEELARIAAAAPEAGRYMAAKVLTAIPAAQPGETRGAYGTRLAKAVRQ